MKSFFDDADVELDTANLTAEFLRCCLKTKYISIEKANRLLEERGTIVCGSIEAEYKSHCFGNGQFSNHTDTHRALLINIELIEKDTSDKFLRDWLQCADIYSDQIVEGPFKEFVERAISLISKEPK
jgi:hypothetical protein